MWMALLAKLLVEIIPKIVDKILKGDKKSFAAVDTRKEIDSIRSGLAEAQAMLDKGE